MMFDLLVLSFKNILRNARRTVVTMSSITVGCASLVCFAGFIQFSFEGLREFTIRNEIGHMQIYKKGYTEHRVSDPTSYRIENATAIIESLSGIPGILTVTGRTGLQGIGSAGKSTLVMEVTGIDAAREIEFGAFERVVEGRHLNLRDTESGIVGSELMNGLDAELGDWVTVFTSTLDGVFNAFEFEVVGVVTTGSRAYDAIFVKVPLELAQTALDTESVERIMVLLNETDELPEIKEQVLSALNELDQEFEIITWIELADFYQSVVNLYTNMFRVFAVIIGIVVLFSVLNTMTMAVLERTGELSALRAIGARKRLVLNMILIEGTIMGIIGGLAGVALAYGISLYLLLTGGFRMSPPPGFSEGFPGFLSINFNDALLAFIISVVAAYLSSFFPAIRTRRTKISEGLRA